MSKCRIARRVAPSWWPQERCIHAVVAETLDTNILHLRLQVFGGGEGCGQAYPADGGAGVRVKLAGGRCRDRRVVSGDAAVSTSLLLLTLSTKEENKGNEE